MRLNIGFLFVIGVTLLASTAFAKVYHIDPTVLKSGNGTASSPFKEWANLPAMSTGDDVYFKCGTTYAPPAALDITWEGTKADPAVIGAYYLSGGLPVYGVSGARPKISGSNHTVPSNACFGSSDSWSGLIRVNQKNYVHIMDLHVINSGWYGVLVQGNAPDSLNSAYFVIKNIRVDRSYVGGIMVNKNPSNYGVIEGCEVTGGSYSWYKGCRSLWAGSIVVANSPRSGTIIRKNYVYENWGEGIQATIPSDDMNLIGSGYVTIEENTIWNNRRVDIYLDRTENNIVKRNICIGAGDGSIGDFNAASADGRGWNQIGIWVNIENRGNGNDFSSSSNNNQIYNNLVAGHNSGIGLSSEFDIGTKTMKNNVFYNNTLIGNRYNIVIGKKIGGYQTSNVVFKNNVSYCPPDTICQDVNTDHTWLDDKILADYNAWTNKPVNFGGPNDRTVNNNWPRVQGWQSLSGIPNVGDFAPLAGNPVVDGGFALPTEYKDGIDALKTRYSVFPGLNISVSTLDQNGNGARWEMGAVVYQDMKAIPEPSTLSPPTLKVIPGSN